MSKQVLIDEIRPHVALMTLNRPDRLNALSWDLVDELHATLDRFERDNATRVVVLTGAGRGFCSGLDLQGGGTQGASVSEGLRGPAGGMRAQAHIAGLMTHLRRIPQPIIAAVNGPAVGGGLALSLFSDIRVAAESARFGVQFIRVGLVARTVPDADLLAVTRAVAAGLARHDRDTLCLAKATMWANLLAPSLDAALALESRAWTLPRGTDDDG